MTRNLPASSTPLGGSLTRLADSLTPPAPLSLADRRKAAGGEVQGGYSNHARRRSSTSDPSGVLIAGLRSPAGESVYMAVKAPYRQETRLAGRYGRSDSTAGPWMPASRASSSAARVPQVSSSAG